MDQNKSTNKFIILGNHIQSLGLIRQAGELGFKVVLFNFNNFSISRYSKYCNEFIKVRNEEELLDKLLKISERAFILPTNDFMVKFLADNSTILKDKYILPFKDPDTLYNCLNKRFTYKIADRSGIPIPDSYFPNNEKELKEILKEISYPVILKPAVMHTYHKVTGKKAVKCNNYEEVLMEYKEFLKYVPSNEIILQQFISSGSAELYSMGVFCHEGKIISGFMANRQRQNPMTFGNSTCYAITVYIPIILEYSKKIVEAINYSGMCEIEFMFDPFTGKYNFLEVNARSWKWHSLANKININFINDWLTINESENVTQQRISKRTNIVWIERITDSYIVFKEIVKGKISIKSYFKSIRPLKEYAVWSKSDPMPAIMYVVLLPILFFKR